MATAWITEYAEGARVFPNTGGVLMPAGQEPATAIQTFSYTTAVASSAFSASTRMVRVYTSAAARIAFGTAPTAVAGSTPVSATSAEYFGVVPGQKISVYDGSS